MAPKRARAKAAPKPRSAEEYLAAALELDASGFLSYFEDKHPLLCRNYEDLCRNSDKLTEYDANPVVFAPSLCFANGASHCLSGHMALPIFGLWR